MAVFNLFDRFAAVLNDASRMDGLDLITQIKNDLGLPFFANF